MHQQPIFQQQRTSTNQLDPNFGVTTTGFVSPAIPYIEESLDLFKTIVTNEVATFYAKIRGDKLNEFNLMDGSYAIIDKSRDVKNNDLVAYWINDNWTVFRAKFHGGKLNLTSTLKNNTKITQDDNHKLFGVIIGVVSFPNTTP